MSLKRLQQLLEASWRPDTAYEGVSEPGNAALGQCYPTARVVQWFFPRFEIALGQVDTGTSLETHFWNIDPTASPVEHVDFTRQQFAVGAKVIGWRLLHRDRLGDSPPTIARCERLLRRVLAGLRRDVEAAHEGIDLPD
jgi:hypothetical protein